MKKIAKIAATLIVSVGFIVGCETTSVDEHAELRAQARVVIDETCADSVLEDAMCLCINDKIIGLMEPDLLQGLVHDRTNLSDELYFKFTDIVKTGFDECSADEI